MGKQGRIAVIGAGLSGLACAYELTKAGYEVVVYEKELVVGGRAGTRHKASCPFDLGAQFLNNSYRCTREYCQELGIEGQWQTMSLATHHQLHEGQLHCISFHSIREFLGIPFYSHLARLRLLMCYLKLQRAAKGIDLYDLSTVDPSYDTINAKDYVLKWGGPEVLEYGFDSLIACYHFHGAEDLSLSCLLGAIAVIGPDFSYDFLVNGIDSIAQALARKVKIVFGMPVRAVNRGPSTVYLEVGGARHHYDSVVIATTASVAKSIYHNPSKPQLDLLDACSYSATINLGFRVPSVPISHLAMVAIPTSQNGNICCYFNQSSKYPGKFEDGQTLVNVFLRDELARLLMNAPDEKIWEIGLREFLKTCPPLQPFADRIYRYDIQRWPEAIPKYAKGYVTRVRDFWNLGQGDKGVFFCGDYLNAPWMEGSLRGGRKVADSVVEAFSLQDSLMGTEPKAH